MASPCEPQFSAARLLRSRTVHARQYAGIGDKLLEQALIGGVDIGVVGIDLARVQRLQQRPICSWLGI